MITIMAENISYYFINNYTMEISWATDSSPPTNSDTIQLILGEIRTIMTDICQYK